MAAAIESNGASALLQKEEEEEEEEGVKRRNRGQGSKGGIEWNELSQTRTIWRTVWGHVKAQRHPPSRVASANGYYRRDLCSTAFPGPTSWPGGGERALEAAGVRPKVRPEVRARNEPWVNGVERNLKSPVRAPEDATAILRRGPRSSPVPIEGAPLAMRHLPPRCRLRKNPRFICISARLTVWRAHVFQKRAIRIYGPTVAKSVYFRGRAANILRDNKMDCAMGVCRWSEKCSTRGMLAEIGEWSARCFMAPNGSPAFGI
ncbi:hypothetical protein KM043_010210 [Ampulex compressa]|nr:hypothetical protein KM043_010210 [Ampulex compressa]